jgi:peptidoglycan hydrolase-like protein with peptidoglycan-binding domain
MLKKIFLLVGVSLFAATSLIAQNTATTTTSTSTTASTTAAKPAVFRPTKDQIKQGQTFLKNQKLYTGEATGVYTDPTRDAIEAYQKANGLDINGKFDKATLEKMGIALTDSQKGITTSTSSSKSSSSSASSGAKRPAPFRASTDQIKAAQKVLSDGKLYAGEQNGKLDDATREALGKYQAANSLSVTNTLNAATLQKMGIALSDAQKANVAAQAAYDASKTNK